MPYWNCPVCGARVDADSKEPCQHVKDIILLFRYDTWAEKFNKPRHIDSVEEFITVLYRDNDEYRNR